EHLQGLDQLLGREPEKTTGAPREAAFEMGPAAKGAVGKADKAQPGVLPTITQKIWQDMLDKKGHVKLPTREEREAFLPKLQEKQQFSKDVASLIRQRAGEKGAFN